MSSLDASIFTFTPYPLTFPTSKNFMNRVWELRQNPLVIILSSKRPLNNIQNCEFFYFDSSVAEMAVHSVEVSGPEYQLMQCRITEEWTS